MLGDKYSLISKIIFPLLFNATSLGEKLMDGVSWYISDIFRSVVVFISSSVVKIETGSLTPDWSTKIRANPEDDEHDVLFDVEGEGEDLTKDQVDDILNAPDTDGKLEDEIRAAYADYKDYSY